MSVCPCVRVFESRCVGVSGSPGGVDGDCEGEDEGDGEGEVGGQLDLTAKCPLSERGQW